MKQKRGSLNSKTGHNGVHANRARKNKKENKKPKSLRDFQKTSFPV